MGQLASAGAGKPYLGCLGSGALDRNVNMDRFAVPPPVQKKMMYGPSRNRLGIDSSAFVGKTQDERGIVTHEIIEFFEVRFAKALV